MTITTRQYKPSDFKPVSDFLIANYQPGNRDGNWLQPAWEYMHHHPNLDTSLLDKIRIWQDGDDIVAATHFEHSLGEAFFQVHADYGDLKPEMLAYAEENFQGIAKSGKRYLCVYVNEYNESFEELVRSRGYEPAEQHIRSQYQLIIPQPFPDIHLTEGFRLKSMAEDNDLRKMHRVLWRGFDHPGEPPEEGIKWREIMQSGPNFRLDLTIVVEAPDGNFVAFCGMWYEPVNRFAYIEPVAVDPDYRRMGLGKAAVLEGIRRCGAEGATVAFVGSDQQFYQSMGFVKNSETQCWLKEFQE